MKGVRVCPECDGTGKTKSERLRDDTAELVEAVLRELQSRGVLVDRYEEVFGAKSFDEVVAALAKRKERS